MSDFMHISEAIPDSMARLNALVDDDVFWLAHEERVRKAEAENERQRIAKADAKLRKLINRIPSQYRQEFEPKRSKLHRDVVKACREWQPDNGQGIGLCGSTGLGKTRVLVRVLMRLKCSWLFIPAQDLADAIRLQYSDNLRLAHDSEAIVEDAWKCRVLMIDDLGQETPTERVAGEMFRLIEKRVNKAMPILWTSNFNGAQLEQRYAMRGPGIVRRLRESSIMPTE